MAKNKSKSQKSKKNYKKKTNGVQKNNQTYKSKNKQTPKKNNNQNQQPKKKTEQLVTIEKKEVTEKTIKKVETPTKQIVDKDKVKYNVVLTDETLKKERIKEEIKKEIKEEIKTEIKQQIKNEQPSKKESLKHKTNTILSKIRTINKNKIKKIKKSKKSKTKEEKPKNIFLRLIYELKNNLHILFNSALIVTYIFLLTGLIRTNTFSTGAIIYISCIVIFLSIVAIGYNKYLSGKVFSLLIICGMGLAIYNMQYTYDFIRNLNTNKYEYKEYYVVTFNNGRNKSIYNINNKKVGLLKENSTNIERILNTKLDSVNYIEYDDPNQLYSDFYNQKYRAIIVNDNQYKYLTNNIERSTRTVKILYKFKANGRK